MAMTKILHANDDNHNLGGAFLITYRTEKYLKKYGYQYDYLSMDHFDADSKYPINPEDKVYSANLRKNRLLGHILLPFYVNKVLKRNSYEVIHIDTDAAWKALLYAIPAKKNGLKTVVHSHAMGVEGDAKWIKHVLESFSKAILIKYTDTYIACSRNAAEWILPKNSNIAVEVITNGIDYNDFYFSLEERIDFRNRLRLDNSIVLGNVGLFSQNKNQKFLVSILETLVKKGYNVKLLLVGNDNTLYGREVRELVINRNLENKVCFVAETSNVRPFLNAMDIYVQASIYEGFGLSAVEAQATGLVTCISDGLPDECCVSDWAVKFNLKNAERQIEQIVLDSDFYEKDRANRKLNAEYSIEYMSKHIADIYNALIKKV